jgi:hypothetical protein
MPRGKAHYDAGTSWKARRYSAKSWEQMGARVRKKIRGLYPDATAAEDGEFGHPADEWANALLYEARSAIGTVQRLEIRRTNEDLRAEQTDIVEKVRSAEASLRNMSHDLLALLPSEVDLDATGESLRALMPHLTVLSARIKQLPRARKNKEVQHKAAHEMAIRCLRLHKDEGGKVAATADKDFLKVSPAVQILKVLGDELGLVLEESTWKKVVIAVRAVV